MGIDNVNRIRDEWETDIYSFDLESGGASERTREELGLRIYPGEGGVIEAAREFRGMRLLHESVYPVPKVHLQVDDDSPLGYPFVIMDRNNSQVMWQTLINATVEEKECLLTRFYDLFVNLHNLDWRPFCQL